MRETAAAMSYLDRRSRTPAESRFATAASTVLPTTGCSSPCASGSSRSSATAAASPHSSTSTTPPQRPCSRSNTTARSTTSSTTSPPQCASGCRCSRTRSEPSRLVTSRSGSRGCSRSRCHAGEPSRGASNAKAKRELGWDLRCRSWRQGVVAATRQPPRRMDANLTRPLERVARRLEPSARPGSSIRARSGTRRVPGRSGSDRGA